MLSGRTGLVLGILAGFAASACNRAEPPRAAAVAASPAYAYGEPIGQFKDRVESNTRVEQGQLDLDFRDTEGKAVDLRAYRGKKHVVLVFTRGFAGALCPNCSAQTSRLISNYGEFAGRGAEVLVVFPGPAQHVNEFIQAARAQAADARLPFPILLDENFKAVDRLGIRGELAKPSTYIIDKDGKVRFAYVGATTTDRPSVKALLDQLDALARN